ncbi:JAB domain-containing protein [Chloroflexota bacterium]
MYLNSKNNVIDTADIIESTVNASPAFPREVMLEVLQKKAVSVILSQNHPSRNPEPSTSDRNLTRELVSAGKVLDIDVLDHIIIGDNLHFSFAAERLIGKYEFDYMTLKMTGTAEAKRSQTSARISLRLSGKNP